MQLFKRSAYCGQINESFLGKEVFLCGWVNKRRDHGNLIFIDLRDRTGIMQLVINPQINKIVTENAKSIRAEFVISVRGEVIKRAADSVNEKIETGNFELKVLDLSIINPSKALPYQLEEADNVDDGLRLKYRYIDLRRKKMHNIIKLRHKIIFAIREYLNKNDFYEIETPILSKSTPEGARDFLVPSRLQPGTFYALPQSPQIYKQLLMASGMEKYFQLARCFRDEDLRSNRQPEFTQLDIEMSFVNQSDVQEMCEGVLNAIWEKIFSATLKLPIPKYTYQQIFKRFGTDKPDMRFDMEIKDFTKTFEHTELKFLKSVIDKDGKVGGICVKNKKFGKAELNSFIDFATTKLGAKGLLFIQFKEDGTPLSPISKFLPTDFLKQAREIISDIMPADTLFLIADNYYDAWLALGKLRVLIADKLNLSSNNDFKFLWITDFPLLEWDKDEKRWGAKHHPFTSPQKGWENLKPEQIKAKSYDIVCNGEELGGGSIRIHDIKTQTKMFELLGISKNEIIDKFGFLLEAQEFGFPPHGGIALGLDRLIMMILKTDSIRDVIAFPKTQSGNCPMMQTPSRVDAGQLQELGIKIISKK
ncbi:aspartate--tRNA ligase [Candidatus Babeliales bacterium]|nr:aspartate--tRNA ligase [Candidatus Babeliales bacterium]